MKKAIIFCVAVLAFSACSNTDDLSVQISSETRSMFQEMYPGAKGVDWEKRGIYKVAIFKYNGQQLAAWYNQDAIWCMTEQRMDYHAAPSQVTGSYRLTGQNTNNVNYVDKLTRDGIEDIYVVVEGNGNNAVEYYYSADGICVKEVDQYNRTYEDYRNEIVPQIPAVVYSTANELYPGARIMEVDVVFPGVLYLDIIHNSTLKTMEFSLTGSWSMTTWAVTEGYVKSQCPDAYSTYTQQGYTDNCEILSIDFYESSSISYYWFVLSSNGTETNLKITDKGKLISVS